EELDTAFERYFKEPFISATSMLQKDNFTPVCNIEEDDTKYYIEADMLGVDSNHIEIEVNSNQLSVKGERKKAVKTENDKNQIHVIERSYGSYFRSFALPENANTEEISADFGNGVLFIKIPKKVNN